jgi:uncharacterized protein with PIN domain
VALMVIDTSALVAILLGEPEAERFARALAAAPVRLLSAVTRVALSFVIEGRKGEGGRTRLRPFRRPHARTIGAFSKRLLGTARSGSPWRDLHAEFGKWNSGFKRLRRWAVNGVFEKIFATLSGDPDF